MSTLTRSGVEEPIERAITPASKDLTNYPTDTPGDRSVNHASGNWPSSTPTMKPDTSEPIPVSSNPNPFSAADAWPVLVDVNGPLFTRDQRTGYLIEEDQS